MLFFPKKRNRQEEKKNANISKKVMTINSYPHEIKFFKAYSFLVILRSLYSQFSAEWLGNDPVLNRVGIWNMNFLDESSKEQNSIPFLGQIIFQIKVLHLY